MHVGTSRSLQRWMLTLATTSLAGAWTPAAAPQAVPQGTSGAHAAGGAALVDLRHLESIQRRKA